MKIQQEMTREMFDHKNEDNFKYVAGEGLTEEVINKISDYKKEPEWMRQFRLSALKIYNSMPIPNWGPDISPLMNDFNKIKFFAIPDAKENATKWEDLPEDVRKTFEKLGIPEAERNVLGGVGLQYESQAVYHNLKKDLEEKGVIFTDCDIAINKYPELFKQHFMTKCVPVALHKFSALHAAVWSGGTFIYIPKGVKVEIPLQAYFRMNAEKMGQFEHTLIIVDEGAEMQYIEGCSSPRYNESSIHAGCVEIHVKKKAKASYISVENWSKNTFNLNTKRAIVDEEGTINWINGNNGCLTEDAKIFTNPKGPKSIKEIEEGEKVFVWDEKTNSVQRAKVKGKIFSGLKKVYKLRAAGREIEASSNHPFLTLVRRKNKPEHKKAFFHTEWKSLEELKVGDIVGIAKKIPIEGKSYRLPKIKIGEIIESKNQYSNFKMNNSHLYNNILIPEETNDDFMWLCGILLGDGHVDLKQNKINIAAHVADDFREDLCKLLNDLFNYKVTEKKERYIIINSKTLCELFIEIGFDGNADTKKVPSWVFTLPESQILSFLAGYFDSDGHPAEDSALAFTSINKKLLKNIQLLGITLGFGVSRVFKHDKGGPEEILGHMCNTQDSWRILFNGKKVKGFPSRSTEKKKKIERIKTRRNYVSAKGLNFKSKVNEEIGFSRINKLEYVGVKPTYDIEVENYHNFIANGLIVHNSRVTMLYPCSVLVGRKARSDFLGIAFAGKGQNQDTGTKIYHLAPETTSITRSKSIAKDGGITSYRGLLKVSKNATNTKAAVQCDALLIDEQSKSNTFPFMEIGNKETDIAHEATVGKISDEQIFYLRSRGLSEEQAMKMIVAGFIEPVVKALPLEYAVELNRLIELEMDKSLG